jgi:predicted dehydrogenase
MIDAAGDAGVALGVDHTLRYHPEMCRLKQEYDDGRLGHVPLCHLARINSGPFETPPATSPLGDWQFDPEATGGGALMDLGIHLFDLLEWLFGGIEVRHAVLDRQFDLEYEDTAAVTLQSVETGTIGTVHCGFYQWEEPPDVNLRARLDGVAATIESTDFVPGFYQHAGTSALANVARRLSGSDPEYFEPTYYYRAHFEALEAFADAVAAGREPPVDGTDGRRAIELVEAAYRVAGTDPPEREAVAGHPSGDRP